MNLSTLIKTLVCLIFMVSVSKAKSTWEVPAPSDTSKKVKEAAAEVGPQRTYLDTKRQKRRLLSTKKSHKKRYNVGKRRAKKPSKSRKSKSAFNTALFLIFFGLFVLGFWAWFGSLALWILGIFHFLGVFALFGSIFLIEDLQGFVLILFLLFGLIPLLAVLGLLSFGLTFFSWGAAVIGGITVGVAALMILISLFGSDAG